MRAENRASCVGEDKEHPTFSNRPTKQWAGDGAMGGRRKMSAKGWRQQQRPLEGRWLVRLGPRAHHFAITEVPSDDPESEGKGQVIFNGYNFKSTNVLGKY